MLPWNLLVKSMVVPRVRGFCANFEVVLCSCNQYDVLMHSAYMYTVDVVIFMDFCAKVGVQEY